MESKCKGCEERHVGCHAKCEDYKNFCKEWAAYKKKIKDAKNKDSEYRQHKNKKVMREMRRKK